MPWVDICSANDRVSIWYITNTLCNNVGGFDPEKPTIIILHPVFLCTRWLENHFGDTRLNADYNLFAFDNRASGRSTAKPSSRHDCWVQAADMALLIQKLHLPPAHILALEAMSTTAALRFAALFPEMCLSLTLCNVPAPTEQSHIYAAYMELLRSWTSADDLDTLENTAKESAGFIAGLDCDVDLQDDLIRYWELFMPPTRAQRIAEQLNALMNRTPMNVETLEKITQPVLILHAERHETHPLHYADLLAEQLINVPGGAIVYTVKGASGCLSIVPGHASIANQAFAKFLSRLPHSRSDIRPPSISIQLRMQAALGVLAEITGDKTKTDLDPLSSLSFSCLSEDTVSLQQAMLTEFGHLESMAFSPLDRDGRPLPRYSQRRQAQKHWFQRRQDGHSYAGDAVTLSDFQTIDPEAEPLPRSLPIPKSRPPGHREESKRGRNRASENNGLSQSTSAKSCEWPASQEQHRPPISKRRSNKDSSSMVSGGFALNPNPSPIPVSFDKVL